MWLTISFSSLWSSGKSYCEARDSCLLKPFLAISCKVEVHQPGKLYLGDRDAANCWPVLRELGISKVVDASQELKHFESLRYLSVDLADSPEEDLLMHLDEVVHFIQEALSSKENVLVHCHMGVSRSASLVIARLALICHHFRAAVHDFAVNLARNWIQAQVFDVHCRSDLPRGSGGHETKTPSSCSTHLLKTCENRAVST